MATNDKTHLVGALRVKGAAVRDAGLNHQEELSLVAEGVSGDVHALGTLVHVGEPERKVDVCGVSEFNQLGAVFDRSA